MQFLVFISLLLPVICFAKPHAGDEVLSRVKRQHPVGMPCRGYEFICNTYSTAVCCHGYCHYDCYDLGYRQPLPQRVWATRPPSTPVPPTTPQPIIQSTAQPTTKMTTPAIELAHVPTPEPCVVGCSSGNLQATVPPPDTALGCSLNFTSLTVNPRVYNATHSVIHTSYNICCPASLIGR